MTLKEIMNEKGFKELNKTLGASAFYGCKFFELTENLIITDYDINTMEPTVEEIYLVFDRNLRRYAYVSHSFLTDIDNDIFIETLIKHL